MSINAVMVGMVANALLWTAPLKVDKQLSYVHCEGIDKRKTRRRFTRDFKTLKYVEVYLNEYGMFTDAIQNIERFIDEVYNLKRLHSSIGYKSPVDFYEA